MQSKAKNIYLIINFFITSFRPDVVLDQNLLQFITYIFRLLYFFKILEQLIHLGKFIISFLINLKTIPSWLPVADFQQIKCSCTLYSTASGLTSQKVSFWLTKIFLEIRRDLWNHTLCAPEKLFFARRPEELSFLWWIKSKKLSKNGIQESFKQIKGGSYFLKSRIFY